MTDTTAIGSGDPEVTKPLTKREATALTKQIQSTVDVTLQSVSEIKELLAQAKTGQAHITLGYPSWTGYVADTLGGKLEVSEATRKNIVKVLAGEGMSTRAIGAATGVSKDTVQRQLSQDETVDRSGNVTSLDGKQRPAKAAAKKAAPKAPAKPVAPHPDQDNEVHSWITLGTMFTPILTGFDTLMDNDEQPSDIDGTIARLQFVSDAINDVITWLKEI